MTNKPYNKEIVQLLKQCKAKDIEVLKALKIVRQTMHYYQTGKTNLRKKRYRLYLASLRAYLEQRIVDFKDVLRDIKIRQFLLDEENKDDFS